MKFDDLFSNCANIYSLKIKQLNDGGASRVIITLLVHRVRRIIALLACYLDLLFSLFKNAFGKRLCRTINSSKTGQGKQQPRSQGLSSYRLGRAWRHPGLVWSRATVTINNIREGSSVIRQFVAWSFAALSRHRHHTRCFKVVFGLKFRSVSSDVYLKVKQVFLETINRGRDAVVAVPGTRWIYGQL